MNFAFRTLSLASVLLALSACGGGGGADPAPVVSIAFSSPPPSTMAVGATATMAALVSGDPQGAAVTWTVSCAATSCGSLSASSTVSGGATTYTAPATTPHPAKVSITATAGDGGAQVTNVVAIAPAAVPTLADGTYVYHLSGQDGIGPYTIAGAFSVAAGTIVAGEQDFSDANAGYTDTLAPATSSISVVGRNIQIVLDTGNTAIGVNGLETLRGTVVSSTRVLLSEFDVSASGTGSLDLQTSDAAPAGGYAFAVSGTGDNGNTMAVGGVLAFDGNALVTNASVFDVSVLDPSTGTSSSLLRQAFQSGSVSAPDIFGRVVIALTPSVGSGFPPLAFAGYVVGPARIQLVESAETADVLNANTGGAALGQGANAGLFGPGSDSVVNQSYAHLSTGADLNNAATMAGAFALRPNGVLGGVLALNDGVRAGAWNLGGSYAVEPNGRVTVSISSLTSQTAAPPATTLGFVLYLDGSGNAMVLGADGFQATQGIGFAQGGSSALGGNYALAAQGVTATQSGPIEWSAVGPVSVSAATFQGTTDYCDGTTPRAALPLGGTQDAGQGLLHLTGLNATDFSATTGYGYYPLGGNRLLAIEVDGNGNGMSLLLLEGVTP